MPPQHGTGASAEDAEAPEAAPPTTLSSLPLTLLPAIFSLLPVDCCLRCAEVRRDWRDALLDRSAWTRLDLSAESGVRVRVEGNHGGGALDALLRYASSRAGGGLQSLDVDVQFVSEAALLEVVTANAGALRELRLCVREPRVHELRLRRNVGDEKLDSWLAADDALQSVEALLRAAPQLCILAADTLQCDNVEAARHVLRNEAPFGPLGACGIFVQP
jgi:hypothetical protein